MAATTTNHLIASHRHIEAHNDSNARMPRRSAIAEKEEKKIPAINASADDIAKAGEVLSPPSPSSSYLSSAVAFVLLDPSPRELRRRLRNRERAGGHFMKACLLDSQLAALSYSEDELLAHIRDGSTSTNQQQ
ncbi:hypothetical protein VOLCADRAFT_95242 [Volvox carteri f. nagariensis]|uniref:Uncharacterized protein n=1 Tax=Volvox carteri f. nagariensis TaxID=3068 RepID=D8U6Z6_VOLCA|nr:uncharacterized protein VOLCADRAFT_95242 [Volvox carteri f. nagariensis]EFJ44599.1 hypothetical protein VOLCADRAFT_95242 [Volvox carteri f. nagariensis]|eukprot:XP_002954449.1 hypothetical protein VOLCADRAFT_95242 [Volvox carteri f. nagariensis]